MLQTHAHPVHPAGPTIRRARGTRIAAKALGLVAVTGALAGLASPPAMAASQITGCFSYAGTRYQNLSTNVEYVNTRNGWSFMSGSVGRTRSNGCVTYDVSGAARRWSLRIHASGAVPNWRGMFSGYSRYRSVSGRHRSHLGEGRMAFYYLPPAATTPPDSFGMTSNWLDGMSSGESGGCGSSAAIMVTCYMDARGMHGNVVVPDRDADGDHVYDWQDRYPQDKYRA